MSACTKRAAGDKALCPAKLDSGEINTKHLQPIAGQLTGCRYPGPATEVNNTGSGPQQASQFRHPADVAADVLCGGGGRIAIITAIGQRNCIITVADKSTPTRPLSHVIVFHHGHLATRPHHRHHGRWRTHLPLGASPCAVQSRPAEALA